MNDYIWTIIGVAAAALTSFSFLPQVNKMWRRKSARDVSNITMFQLTAGNGLWLAYGVGRHDPVIIGANIIAISILIVGIVLYYRYQVKDS
jgi:MtN3 and saliva related transmembrane protein